MSRKVIISTCTLNQWALDFEGNFRRIVQSKKKIQFFKLTRIIIYLNKKNVNKKASRKPKLKDLDIVSDPNSKYGN